MLDTHAIPVIQKPKDESEREALETHLFESIGVSPPFSLENQKTNKDEI